MVYITNHFNAHCSDEVSLKCKFFFQTLTDILTQHTHTHACTTVNSLDILYQHSFFSIHSYPWSDWCYSIGIWRRDIHILFGDILYINNGWFFLCVMHIFYQKSQSNDSINLTLISWLNWPLERDRTLIQPPCLHKGMRLL